MFREFITHSRREFENVEWDVFLPRGYEWKSSEGVCAIPVDVDSACLPARLAADHYYVPRAAQKRGCKALVTVGFLPEVPRIPAAVHLLTLHHLDRVNRTGWLRAQYRRREVRRVLDRAQLVITNSQTAANELMQIDVNVRGRLLVSSEGIQHDVFFPDPPHGEAERLGQRYLLAPGYVLWVSNFYPYKQLELFLTAYAGLTAAEREQHPAVLVGGDWQDERARALRLADSLGIAANLRFLGWVEDEWVAPLYRHAALHVLASRAETFGRSVLEAMACGVLCVVNDIPILREVTAGHALFTDFAGTEASTAALRLGLTDTDSNRDLRDQALRRAREFSMQKLARERVAAMVERFG